MQDLNRFNLDDLYNRIKKLFSLSQQEADIFSIHKKVLLAYKRRTLTVLKQIFVESYPNNADLAVKLQHFLETNWHHIKGTCVCYTSLPEDEITILLSDLAKFAACQLNNGKLKENPIGALNLLMPAVNTESADENRYPHLGAYEEIDGTKCVAHNVDERFILKTHILSQNGQYLIPVQVLPELLEAETKNLRYNYYFHYQRHAPQNAFVNDAELKRLISHSNITEALHKSYARYAFYIHDESHLLGKLNQLCSALYAYSVNDLGEEDNAGIGVYAAIIEFKDYYESLGERKALIPRPVKKEIDLLIALSSDVGQNKNATETIETCIALRRRSILEAMRGFESKLSQILPGQEVKNTLFVAVKREYEHAKSLFYEAFHNGKLAQGRDNLPLTGDLVRWLKLDCSIQSSADLSLFNELRPEEIESIYEDKEHLAEQIAEQITDIEDFLMFAIELKPAVFATLLPICISMLIQQGVINAQLDLDELLSALGEERGGIFLATIKNHLPLFIEDIFQLRIFFEQLRQEQLAVLLSDNKGLLESYIHQASDFSELISDLPPMHRNRIFNLYQNQLPGLIENALDFASIAKYIELEHCQILYRELKDDLPSLINSPEALNQILICANSSQYTIFFSDMDARGLIKSHEDLKKALMNLNASQCLGLADILRHDLLKIIGDKEGFYRLLSDCTDSSLKKNIMTFSIPVLERLLDNVEADLPRFSAIFTQRADRQYVHQCYFNSLLTRLNQYGDEGFALCESLKTLSDNYFSAKTISYEQFKARSEQSIDLVREYLAHKQSLLLLAAKWLLAIATLGTVLIADMIKNKIESGAWTCRYFSYPGEDKVNKLEQVIEYEESLTPE